MEQSLSVRKGEVIVKLNGEEIDVKRIYKKLNDIGNITQSFEEKDTLDKRLVILGLGDNTLIEGEFSASELKEIAEITEEFRAFIGSILKEKFKN